jgi:hypothetical protein
MVTLFFALFHIARGAIGQTYLNPMIKEKKLKETWQNIIVIYIHDFILHFTCTVFGFICIYVAFKLGANGLAGLTDGAAILFVTLGVLGLAGITGQLAALLAAGKLPWMQ